MVRYQCMLLGLMVLALRGRADEAATVKAVQNLGGKIKVDGKRSGNHVVAVSLSGTKIADAVLKELRGLKNLQVLDLRGRLEFSLFLACRQCYFVGHEYHCTEALP